MTGEFIRRLTLAGTALLLICVIGICNAQNDPRPDAPKAVQSRKDSKPEKFQPKAINEESAEDSSSSGNSSPSAFVAVPVNATKTDGKKPTENSKSTEKPLPKSDILADQRGLDGDTELVENVKNATKAPGKLPLLPQNQDDVHVTDVTDAPPNGSSAQREAKIVETPSLKNAVPPAGQNGPDNFENSGAQVNGSQIPKAANSGERPVANSPNNQEGAEVAEIFEAVPSGSPIPKGTKIGGKSLQKTAAPSSSQGGDQTEGNDFQSGTEAPLAPTNNSKTSSKQNDTTNERSPKGTSQTQTKATTPNGVISEESTEGRTDTRSELSANSTTPTKKPSKDGAPKPKDAAAPTDEAAESAPAETFDAKNPLEPKENFTRNGPTATSTKQNRANQPIGDAQQKPRASINVPGGPSFQPLEGGAVPPVLARANAVTSKTPVSKQPAATRRPNHAVTTPTPESAETSSEEASGDESGGEGVDQGLIAIVNAEYGAALRNLSQAGVLAESDHQNRHLSDLFALILENVINSSPTATEKNQRQIVHRAAVDFQQIFKAKAVSMKNVSEIVRVLNEQILSSSSATGERPTSRTAAPVDVAARINGPPGSTLGNGSAGFETRPPWKSSLSGSEDSSEVEDNSVSRGPASNALETVRLLQDAQNGQNKSLSTLDAKNASINEEKGNFPVPPAWKIGSVSPFLNISGSIETGTGQESSEEVNATEIAWSQRSPTLPETVTTQNLTSVIPTAEPGSYGSLGTNATGAASPSVNISEQSPVPVAEPRPTAEPGPNSTATVAVSVSSTEDPGLGVNSSVTDSPTGGSANSTSSAGSPSSAQSPSSPSSANVSGTSTWETPSAEPSPINKSSSASTPTTSPPNVLMPWSFKIVDPQTEWDSELINKESFQYKTLYGSLISDLKTMFKKLESQRFIGVSIKRFSQGSVIVEGETQMTERVESGQLLENFLKLLKEQQNKIGGRIVDPITVTFDGRPSSEFGRASTGLNGVPVWAIGLAVGGALLASIIIAAALIIMRGLRDRRLSPSSSAADAEIIKTSSQRHHRPSHPRRRHSDLSTVYDTYSTRADYYRHRYQPPYVAPGAIARPCAPPPNYYNPYYHQHQGPYAYW